ncbi:ABC transporter permease subunit [Pseudothauera nasutitermitis]|uniref:ABC transporter permease subunit n=1 Tax=Pseudothauera nasutitermitis TaxID=2565930 RepID=A0A4S4AWW4_9RHOO|nr:ABC transporter permease subunit [Pseudothauera nasutitermitis]THF64557.1 ABC transporter permease subunit [Pseudothauera nasutitermitis]
MNTLALPSAAHYGKRPLGHFYALLALLLAVLAAFFAAEWDWAALTDAERRAQAAARIGAWLTAFAQPDLSAGFLRHAWDLTLQTLSAAVLGTALAVLFAWPLAMGASRAVCVGEEHGRFARGWWRHFPLRSPAALLCAACRLLQDILRAVPDFVWAIILVAMIGLGPLTGALALALNITGILAKVYSELWDGVDESRYAQVRSLGGGRLATFLYGIRPLAARNVLSFTLMRAECAIRNAAVIGAVGGGGLGSEIWYQIRFGAWDKVSTLILFTLLLTLTADLASNYVRRQLRGEAARAGGGAAPVVCTGVGSAVGETAANRPQATSAPAAPVAARPPLRPWLAAGFVALVAAWSIWFMGWGNHAGDNGAPRNHLAPATELFTGQAWQNLRFFERLLAPELDLPAIGLGDPAKAEARAAQGKAVDLFAQYGPAQFWQAAAWAAWQEELRKWFVWRVVESAAVPLAIAVVGTVLGVGAAILLTYPHSASFQLHAQRFTGEAPGPWRRLQRAVQLAAARASAMVARGVPEVMWAFLFIAFFGPGLVAGTLAIAVHTLGVLTRVFGEAIDNQPLRRFEPTCGASRPATYAVVAGPLAWRDWMTYSFFQFESNVRAAVVLGLVGVGGLGFQFSFNFEWFRFERAGTYLIMIILLTVLIDRGSRMLKLSRVGR